MSTSDAYVRIMCDCCNDEEEADLPFVYGGIMHSHGHYDHENPRLPQGWRKNGEDDHLCEDCAAARGMQ